MKNTYLHAENLRSCWPVDGASGRMLIWQKFLQEHISNSNGTCSTSLHENEKIAFGEYYSLPWYV